MEKKDIIILAAAVILGVGMRLIRSYAAKKKKSGEKDQSGKHLSKKEDEDDGGYEPYSGN